MKYLIKSLKWTKHSKVETWYKEDSNGYTESILNAGIYTEEDKIKMNIQVEGNNIRFISITEKIINKFKKQISYKMDDLEQRLRELQNDYILDVTDTKRMINELSNKKIEFLKKLENEVKL